MNIDRTAFIARTLGALSVASGSLLLAFPQPVARVYALPSASAAFVRCLGVRDIAIGSLLLTAEWRKAACLARALSDAIDAALIAVRGARGTGLHKVLGRLTVALATSAIGFYAFRRAAHRLSRQ